MTAKTENMQNMLEKSILPADTRKWVTKTKIRFFKIAQIGLKPCAKDAPRCEDSGPQSDLAVRPLSAELRPFYCGIRISVPMSIMFLL